MYLFGPKKGNKICHTMKHYSVNCLVTVDFSFFFTILINLPLNLLHPNLWSHELSLQLHKYWQSSPKLGNLQATEQLKLWNPKGHSVKKTIFILRNLTIKRKPQICKLWIFTFTFRLVFVPERTWTTSWDSLRTENVFISKYHMKI